MTPSDRPRRRGPCYCPSAVRATYDRYRRPVLSRLIPVVWLAALAAASPCAAQSAASVAVEPGKKVLGVDDYARWRSIEGAQISGDGKWVAYALRFTNVRPADSKPSLRIVHLATGNETAVEGASSPVFSPDSRWLAYALDSVPARRPPRGDSTAEQGTQRGSAAQPARMELRDLATGATQSWQNMNSATFSPTSSHLLLRRRASGGARGGQSGSGAQATGSNASRGSEVVLHDLAGRHSLFLGSVGEASFNRQGTVLAYTVDATVKDGNGLFLIDLPTARMRTLDNDTSSYNRIAWSDDGNAIAVLKSNDVERKRERSSVLLVLGGIATATPSRHGLNADSVAGFPKDVVISDRAALGWSEDGQRVFFGIIPQTAAPDTSRRRSTDSIADVDVWRTRDRRIQSVQMIRAEADRNFTFRQAFDVRTNRFVALADSTMRDLQLSLDGRWAVGRDDRAYLSDYGPARADIYRVHPSTGERTLMLKGQLTGQHVFGIAPDGRHFLFWKDGRYQLYDLDTGAVRTIGAGATGLTDTEFDRPGPRPAFGVEGYTADGKGVIVADEYDLWLLPFDGSAARSLTGGAGARDSIRFRYVRTEPIDSSTTRRVRSGELINLSKPVTLSAYGKYTKQAGFYELSNGKLKPIVFDDASFSTPSRARHADTWLFTRQTFAEFPDLRVSGRNFRDSKQISHANPQQAEYMWGRRILFDYANRDGLRLQGILALPDDYREGEKRPMLVTFYEKNSQNLNRYSAPSFLTGMGASPIEAVSRGYITMMPDVHFRTGSSHSDMLEAVEAAVKKVIELGYADPARIGVSGHSYGGEGAAFIATQSKLFAAVGMGAGVTDLFSDFNQSWGWSYQVTGGSGANGSDYYLYGQGRWGFSPWEKPDIYRFESALSHADKVSAPVLIMHGTADPTVAFSEGMNFYNALRYNGKEAIMLAYPGEGHGLRGLANRRDLTIRFFQFFDHHLRGAPAPRWMTEEVPYLRKDELRDPVGK